MRFSEFLPLPFDVVDLLLGIRLFIVRLTLETLITFTPITLMISSHSLLSKGTFAAMY